MPRTARRLCSCQPQLHKRKIFGHSAASYRLWLARSQCSVPSLAWSGLWPQVPECCWSSSTVGACGWHVGGCKLISPRFPSWSFRSQHRKPSMNDPQNFRASVGSSKRNTIGEAPALLVAVRFWLSRGFWRASGLIRCHHAGARMVRLSSKSADLKRHCLGTCLGRCLGLVLSLICHVCGSRTHHRGLWSACHCSRLQFWVVGSGRPPLQSTGAEQWQEHSHRHDTKLRGFRAPSSWPWPCSLYVYGSSRSPGPAHCHVACAVW